MSGGWTITMHFKTDRAEETWRLDNQVRALQRYAALLRSSKSRLDFRSLELTSPDGDTLHKVAYL